MTRRERAEQLVHKYVRATSLNYVPLTSELVLLVEAALREQWEEAAQFVRRADWVVSDSQQREAMSDALVAKAKEGEHGT